MGATNIYDEFSWRGLLYDATEGAKEVLIDQRISVYNGFDPTAESLHVGNLVPMMQLARLQRFGHTPIALAGGGTGMIGDPSGRSEERNLLSTEQLARNLHGIRVQLASVLDFDVKSNPAKIVNNAEWLTEISLMDFLRDTGKQFTINYMLAKDSVKSRLHREDGGISFTEFSYMLLQAYDFQHLFEHENCVMQAGGSDQWGNITAGVQLIRKALGKKAYGIAYPLITKADGTKFGKTASGAVWLDPTMTSPYRFFQFWMNTADGDVINYMKIFTWLDEDEINGFIEEVADRPNQRNAQRKLAQHMTDMIHGPTALTKAEQASSVLFGGSLDGLAAEEIADIFSDVPSISKPRAAFEGEGIPLVDLLVEAGAASSRGDARRAIKGGGININNQRVSDVNRQVDMSQCIDGKFVVLRKGKRHYHLIQLMA